MARAKSVAHVPLDMGKVFRDTFAVARDVPGYPSCASAAIIEQPRAKSATRGRSDFGACAPRMELSEQRRYEGLSAAVETTTPQPKATSAMRFFMA